MSAKVICECQKVMKRFQDDISQSQYYCDCGKQRAVFYGVPTQISRIAKLYDKDKIDGREMVKMIQDILDKNLASL